MTDQRAFSSAGRSGKDTGVAAVGTVASLTALFSAAACCVLPLALAGLGIGAGGLSGFGPYRWPLTIAAAVAVAVGWVLYLCRRRACIADANCGTSAPSTATLVMLCIATVIVAVSALWGFIEQPLMRALGGV